MRHKHEKNKFYVPKLPKTNYDSFMFYRNISKITNIKFSKIIFITGSQISSNLKIYLNNLSLYLVSSQSDITVFMLDKFISVCDEIKYHMIFPCGFWNCKKSNIVYVLDSEITTFEPFYFINYIDNLKIKNIFQKLDIEEKQENETIS